jgi:hypothetical protein
MRRLRYIASILLSACLWVALPLALGFLNDKLTLSGRAMFIQGLPKTILFSILFFLPVAALMHWLWATTTLEAKGARFWLLPVKTLPTAFLIGWVLLLPLIVLKERFWLHPLHEAGVALIYSFLLGAVVILGSLCWVVYPLAILNQLIIRAILTKDNKC